MVFASFVVVIRTNAALLRVHDEINKFARRGPEFYCRGFFNRLGNVQSARVNKFECRFDFIAVFGTESSTA